MHIRDLVKQKWEEAGLYNSKNLRIKDFLKYFDDNPNDCLERYIKEFRREKREKRGQSRSYAVKKSRRKLERSRLNEETNNKESYYVSTCKSI